VRSHAGSERHLSRLLGRLAPCWRWP
jgi:hypothetical protein